MRKDNRKRCNDCNNYLCEKEFVHGINYGHWDTEHNTFENDGQEEFYCRECWQENSPMQTGMKYEVEQVEELIGMLESSNGDLVADFNSQTLGSRVYLRIVGDRAELAYVKIRSVGKNDIGFTSKFEKKSVEEGRELIDSLLMSGSMPPIVILVSSEDTPFSEYPNNPEEQSQIEDF